MKILNIKIIGLGGVGSILSEKVCRFVEHLQDIQSSITLVDGDDYERKNLERQEFSEFGNKARIKEVELSRKFNETTISSIPSFVDEEIIPRIVEENDIILLGVDNHKTRKLVSDFCKELHDVTLISGGNEFTDGNVQIYVRREGKDLTPDLCSYHPEIQNPVDKSPDEMSCEELSQSEPQLFFTNLGVATIMCWALYNVAIKENYKVSEIYFDVLTMSADSKFRVVKRRR